MRAGLQSLQLGQYDTCLAEFELRRYTILHTIEGSGPGGAETVLLELASKVSRERYRSLAFLPEGNWLPGKLHERGVPYVIAKSKTWYDLIRDMRSLVRAEGVDLIHSHLDDQNFSTSVVGKLTGCKTIVTYHGAPRLARQQGLRRKIKAWVPQRFATEITVVSDYLRNTLVESGFPPHRTHRVYNGVDLGRFASGEAANLRGALGLPPHAKLVGMVANLRQAKGYEYFVQSARAVVDVIPESYFLAVGETAEAMLARLQDLVRQLKLDARVSFLGFRKDVHGILRDLDVFVLTSTNEGLSISTIEAMAAGKPVVVTRSGGPEEIVEDGITGYLVPPADAGALAARVCEILRNPDVGRCLGSKAQAAVARKFSLQGMVEQYESLYQRCLGEN